MFHLQPGNGLGYSGSRKMAFGLGGFEAIVGVIITTGGIWIAHATGHLWNSQPVATAWQAVCSVINWKADDC